MGKSISVREVLVATLVMFVAFNFCGHGPLAAGEETSDDPPASAETSAATSETPIGPRWWPSRYGADDQRGATNLITAEKVLQAIQLVRDGRVIQLGRVYEREMPTFPHRTFRLTIPTFREVLGENRRVGRDEFFVGEIGQMGTQMDGLGHVGVRLQEGDTYYNGFRSADIEEPYGLTKLGVENVGVFFTRGVLIDVAADRGVERLPVGFEITAEQLVHAARSQRVQIDRGDVVLIRTGHGKLWKVDNDAYNSGQPGIGLEAARWLIERDICAVGADNWGIEVDPSPVPERPLEVHQQMITRHGIYFLENLNLDELAEAGTHEFAFIFAPLRLKGATGSPGNPIAVL